MAYNITWSKIEMGASLETIRGVEYNNGRWLVGSGDTSGDADIYYSDNSFSSNTKIELGYSSNYVAGITKINNTTLLAVTVSNTTLSDNKILKSTDNGASWTEKYNLGTAYGGNFNGIKHCAETGITMAIITSATGQLGIILKSIDDGENWTLSKSISIGGVGGFQCIDCDINGNWFAGIYKAGASAVCYSLDDGANWSSTSVTLSNSIDSIKCIGSNIVLAASRNTDGTSSVCYSDDSFLTYTKRNMSATYDRVLALEYLGDNYILIGCGTSTGDGDILISSDYAQTTAISYNGSDLEFINSIKYNENGTIIAGSGSGTGDGDVIKGVLDVALSPKASKISDRYYQHLEVELFSPIIESSIYYTIDGSTPTISSNLYTTPLWITKDTTLKLIASGGGFSDSSVLTRTYEIRDYDNRPDYNISIYDNLSINFGVQGKTDILSEKRRHRTIDFIDGGVGEQFVNVKRTVNLTIDKMTQEDRDDLYTLWSSQEAFYIETEKNEFIKVRYIAPTFTIAQDESYEDKVFYRGAIELKEA